MIKYQASAYIFDKDGTLIDTESAWYETFQRLLAAQGYHHDLKTHCSIMGASMNVCLEILRAKHPHLRIDSDSLFQVFRETRKERGIIPMKGVHALLKQCHRPRYSDGARHERKARRYGHGTRRAWME